LALLISKVAGEMEALDEDAAVMGEGAEWLWVSKNRLFELSAKNLPCRQGLNQELF
jgi:hypothetical protein